MEIGKRELYDLQKLLCEREEILDKYLKESIVLLINTNDAWERKALGEVATLASRNKKNYGYERYVSYIPTTSVKNGVIIKRNTINAEDSKPGDSIALPGEILICKIVDSLKIGRYALVDYIESSYALVAAEFLVLSPSDCVFPEWVLLFLGQKEALSMVCDVTSGTAMQRINKDFLMNFKIPCPPLETQKEILLQIHDKKLAYLLRRNQTKFLQELTGYIIRNNGSLANSQSGIFDVLKMHLSQGKDLLDF